MYQLIPVNEKLSPYVDCFWQSNFDNLGKEVYAELFNAQCTPNLIFNIGSSYQLNQVEVKNSVLRGFNASPVRCIHTADNKLFGIRFRPLGLSMFTKLPYLVLNSEPISVAHFKRGKIVSL